MPEATFFPYRFADAALEVKPVSLHVDGQEVELARVVHADAKVINLSLLDHWNDAELVVEVTDPNDQLSNVIGGEENVDDCLEIHSLVRCRKSRFREAFALQSSEGQKWTGSIRISRHDCLGGVSLQTVALRKNGQTETENIASRKGQRTADSEPWAISVDESATLPGGAIDNEWRHFSEDSDDELSRRSDCGWFLDLRQSDKPKLYLNEDIPGLKDALGVEQKIGQAARVRDVLIHSIIQPVAVSFVLSVLKDAKGCELEELESDQQNALLHFANQIDTGSAEIIAERWLKEFKDDFQNVLQDLGVAAQRAVGFSKGAEHLIKTYGVNSDE